MSNSKYFSMFLLFTVCITVFIIYRFFPIRYYDIVSRECKELDPLLVMALIKVESGFREDVVSPAGAVGLMQIMPQTAEWLKSKFKLSGDVRRVEDNIVFGLFYLRYLKNLYEGDVEKALMAYYVGPSRVNECEQEAKNYVRKVIRYYKIYRALYFWMRWKNESGNL
ncbi:lytic transglycosylase domain-containing protein [Pseudothermotoga sp.]|uniref:lytic transglycosylase domain-containing protein n=1 Tax=Pseudothermotoga sp. TaxID=2033661 RepID=UPI0031F70D37